MFAVRESSGVGVNLTWLIPRKVSLPLFIFPSLSSSPPLPPLFLSLSVPSVSPFLVPSHATERDGKKNREPGERTASSAPENTGRQFCATVPGGWASESGSHTLVFFLLVHVHFALVFNFHSRREKLRRSL